MKSAPKILAKLNQILTRAIAASEVAHEHARTAYARLVKASNEDAPPARIQTAVETMSHFAENMRRCHRASWLAAARVASYADWLPDMVAAKKARTLPQVILADWDNFERDMSEAEEALSLSPGKLGNLKDCSYQQQSALEEVTTTPSLPNAFHWNRDVTPLDYELNIETATTVELRNACEKIMGVSGAVTAQFKPGTWEIDNYQVIAGMYLCMVGFTCEREAYIALYTELLRELECAEKQPLQQSSPIPELVEEYSTIEQKINELTTQENELMQNMWSNVQIMSRINIPDMLKLKNLVKEKRELFQHAHTIRLKIVAFAELNTTPLAVNQFRLSAQQIARMWDAYESGLYQTEKAFGLPLHSLVNLSHKYTD
ncbi:hypothetical protein [Salmonella bongori]|uniref:hypothetical protein n=1 Tax=Salmonella bongori TaxID=54736 RepID=UPI0015EC5AFE|nr:hypothetical protein [Salmonella bongori]MBA3226015.1 hypothetical protein [Salmonella bongori]